MAVSEVGERVDVIHLGEHTVTLRAPLRQGCFTRTWVTR